jgi:hypothetical protein
MWRPISTAPKDGKPVLLLARYCTPFVGRWAVESKQWWVLSDAMEVSCGSWCQGGTVSSTPACCQTDIIGWVEIPEWEGVNDVA